MSVNKEVKDASVRGRRQSRKSTSCTCFQLSCPMVPLSKWWQGFSGHSSLGAPTSLRLFQSHIFQVSLKVFYYSAHWCWSNFVDIFCKWIRLAIIACGRQMAFQMLCPWRSPWKETYRRITALSQTTKLAIDFFCRQTAWVHFYFLLCFKRNSHFKMFIPWASNPSVCCTILQPWNHKIISYRGGGGWLILWNPRKTSTLVQVCLKNSMRLFQDKEVLKSWLRFWEHLIPSPPQILCVTAKLLSSFKVHHSWGSGFSQIMLAAIFGDPLARVGGGNLGSWLLQGEIMSDN